jgi:hypothetical protein
MSPNFRLWTSMSSFVAFDVMVEAVNDTVAKLYAWRIWRRRRNGADVVRKAVKVEASPWSASTLPRPSRSCNRGFAATMSCRHRMR